MIRASIIVPAYNAERFVATTVASALAQTEQRIEVLVVDDASTDGTAEAVYRAAAGDKRVHLLRLNINSGPAAARNFALSQAVGEWIALLDADDTFATHRIARLTQLGDACQADMVSDNLLLCPEAQELPPRPMLPASVSASPWRMSAAEFVAGNIGRRRQPRTSYGFMQPLFHREFLVRHRLRYKDQSRFGEDFLFYLDCLLAGASWWVTSEPMYRYAVRSGSLTEIQRAADLNRIRMIEQRLLQTDPSVAADARLADALRRHKTVIDRCYYYRAFTDAIKSGRRSAAMSLLFESPKSFAHILCEGAAQAPTIMRKAFRGGYRATASRRLTIPP
ncbi:MAG TPA: glycosyltransferase family 2 protein [Acetobacteraceae bacterium]|nr:glycosyltransferase family 2 protein [Acetobacteraceae bacterium]